jgi:hypothetical protein
MPQDATDLDGGLSGSTFELSANEPRFREGNPYTLACWAFEPAHFVRERRMLLGIKDRTQRARSPTTSRAK